MKKILFLAIILLVAGSVSAQRRYYHSPRNVFISLKLVLNLAPIFLI